LSAFKITIIVILSVLLFFSLNILAAGIAVDRTILNAGYINSAIEKLDLPAVMQEAISSDLDEGLPPEALESLVYAAGSLEAEIKTRLGYAVTDVYEYIRGGTSQIDLPRVLRNSLLADEFINSFIGKLDIKAISHDIAMEMTRESVPGEISYYVDLPGSVDKVIQDNEPQLKSQLQKAACSIAAWLTGESGSADSRIDIEPLIEDLRQLLVEDFIQAPPAYLAGFSEQEITAEFNRLFDQYTSSVPRDIDIIQMVSDNDLKAEFDDATAITETALVEARDAASIFKTAFIISVVTVFVLGVLIVLVHANAGRALFNLGIVLVVCGLFVLAAVLIGKSLIPREAFLPYEAQSVITNWAAGTIHAAFNPVLVTGLVYLALGILMNGTYFVMKRQERY